MPLIPKVRFKWREPKAYVAERDGSEREAAVWWHPMVGVVIVALMMMTLWYFATLNPQKQPPSFEVALMLAVFFGIFLSYLVPWMIRLCPSEIRLTDPCLFVSRGNRQRSAKWKEIDSFTFAERDGFRVLRLDLCNGGLLELGLDSTVPVAEVGSFLLSAGVRSNHSEENVVPYA